MMDKEYILQYHIDDILNMIIYLEYIGNLNDVICKTIFNGQNVSIDEIDSFLDRNYKNDPDYTDTQITKYKKVLSKIIQDYT